jgi:hypothetical protein
MVVRRNNCSSMALSSVGGAGLPAGRLVDGDLDDSCLTMLTFRFFDVLASSTTDGS